MPKKSDLELIGTVTQVLGNNNFMVDLEIGGKSRSTRCYLSGRIRKFQINIMDGDKVRVEISAPFEIGRITYREKV